MSAWAWIAVTVLGVCFMICASVIADNVLKQRRR